MQKRKGRDVCRLTSCRWHERSSSPPVRWARRCGRADLCSPSSVGPTVLPASPTDRCRSPAPAPDTHARVRHTDAVTSQQLDRSQAIYNAGRLRQTAAKRERDRAFCQQWFKQRQMNHFILSHYMWPKATSLPTNFSQVEFFCKSFCVE